MAQIQQVADQYNISRHLPAESLQQTRPRRDWPTWHQYLSQLCDEADADNAFNEILRHRKWLQVVRYYEGQQGGFIDAQGAWQTVSRRPGDAIHVSNIFQYFVNILVKECLRAQSRLQVRPRGDRFEHEFGARVYNELFKIIQEHAWTQKERNRDLRNAILTGNAFTRVIKVNDYERMRKVPRYETKSNQLAAGVFTCIQCDHVGYETDFETNGQRCPYCGANSEQVSIRRGASVEHQELVGYDDCPGARLDTIGLSPFAMKLDSSATDLRGSSFVRVSMLCSDEVLQAMYPWAQIGGTVEQDQSLRMQQQLQRSPGNFDGQGTPVLSTAQTGKSIHREYYFRPSRYCNYEWPHNEIMANGEIVPKGTRAIDLYPKELKVVRDGNGLILSVGPAEINKEFTHWVWDMQTESPYGIGVEHALESNTARNELMSLAKAIVMNNAAFSLIVNQKKIRRSALMGKPGHVAVMEKPGPNDNPGNYIYQPQLKDYSAGITQLVEQQKADMEMESGGTLALDTMPASETLGAMQIRRDAAVSGLIPRLSNRDARDVELAYMWAEHLAEDSEMALELYKEISEVSDFEIESFASIVPRRHLVVTVADGSNVPRSHLEKRAMAMETLTVGGLPGGVFNPAIPGPVREYLLENAGLPYRANDHAIDQRNQLLEIKRLIMMAERVQVVEENILGQIRMAVPVRIYEDDHTVHMETIIKYLKGQGRTVPDNVRAILMDHYLQHKQASQMLMAEATMQQGQQAALAAAVSPQPPA